MPKREVCFVCGKENLTRDEIGINKKLIGRNVSKYHCMKCLADFFEISVDDLEEKIQEFKNAGCTLFK